MGSVVKVGVAGAIVAASVWTTLVLSPPPESEAESPVRPVEGVVIDIDAGPEVSVPPTGASPDLPAPHPLTGALCPKGMNWVEGDFCPKSALSAAGCRVAVRGLGFCIDIHEYPNQTGVLPAVMVSFRFAEELCTQEGKRLCSDSEWTLACRTPEDLQACNHGHPDPTEEPARLWARADVARNLWAMDARRPSGPSRCVSPSGVFDLPGNVREWVRSERGGSYAAALKGGGYTESSIDCERSTQTQLLDNSYPETGFRCCREPLVRLPVGP